jgi:hypothetical protein
MAAQYDKFGANRGHPEAKVNSARCLRLLGRWESSDRSFDEVSHSPVGDHFAGFFRPFLQNREVLDGDGDGDGERLLSSFRRMKTAALAVLTSANPASVGKTIQSGDSSVVQLS